MAVLQPNHVGLPFSCVLTLPYIFPDVESFNVINIFHFLLMLLLLYLLFSVYLMWYLFLIVRVIEYYESRPFISNYNCLFVPVSYFFQCNLFFSSNIMLKIFLTLFGFIRSFSKFSINSCRFLLMMVLTSTLHQFCFSLLWEDLFQLFLALDFE